MHCIQRQLAFSLLNAKDRSGPTPCKKGLRKELVGAGGLGQDLLFYPSPPEPFLCSAPPHLVTTPPSPFAPLLLKTPQNTQRTTEASPSNQCSAGTWCIGCIMCCVSPQAKPSKGLRCSPTFTFAAISCHQIGSGTEKKYIFILTSIIV